MKTNERKKGSTIGLLPPTGNPKVPSPREGTRVKKVYGSPGDKSREEEWKDKLEEKSPPVLYFTPYSWAKLLYLRDISESEVGGFGITRGSNLLVVEDIVVTKQLVSPASVNFRDEGISEFFNQMLEEGRKPENYGRIWIHTHPGSSPDPSSIDEEVFLQVFGHCHWAVMFIIAREDQCYARLSTNVGPGLSSVIPVNIDYSTRFCASDPENWAKEYEDKVTEHFTSPLASGHGIYGSDSYYWQEEAMYTDPLTGTADIVTEPPENHRGEKYGGEKYGGLDLLYKILDGNSTVRDLDRYINLLPAKLALPLAHLVLSEQVEKINELWEAGALD